jgi:D-amino-acid dehydrogenase
VLAAGVDTPALLRPLGVRLRMEGAKGYSITAAGSGRAPQHALYFVESKVGCSPFDGAVRLAGTLELGSRDLLLNDTRVAAIARSAEAYLDDWRPERPELLWAGFRPMPADGLPIVGEVPGLPGLHVATGHGMLGVTLAPATGAAVAELLTGGGPVDRLAPFAVGRVM